MKFKATHANVELSMWTLMQSAAYSMVYNLIKQAGADNCTPDALSLSEEELLREIVIYSEIFVETWVNPEEAILIAVTLVKDEPDMDRALDDLLSLNSNDLESLKAKLRVVMYAGITVCIAELKSS